MDKNEEKAYEDGFVAGMQHDAESRVSKFIDASMRKWVGLTDEEITEIRLKTFDAVATNYEVYRAIEAKLKEKNGG